MSTNTVINYMVLWKPIIHLTQEKEQHTLPGRTSCFWELLPFLKMGSKVIVKISNLIINIKKKQTTRKSPLLHNIGCCISFKHLYRLTSNRNCNVTWDSKSL